MGNNHLSNEDRTCSGCKHCWWNGIEFPACYRHDYWCIIDYSQNVIDFPPDTLCSDECERFNVGWVFPDSKACEDFKEKEESKNE